MIVRFYTDWGLVELRDGDWEDESNPTLTGPAKGIEVVQSWLRGAKGPFGLPVELVQDLWCAAKFFRVSPGFRKLPEISGIKEQQFKYPPKGALS